MLTFDATTHEYRVGGKVIPSVTQVLQATGFIDPTWYTPAAAERGHYIHETIRLAVKGTLDESDLDESLASRLAAFRKFVAESGYRFDPEMVEKRVFSHAYGFAGTFDMAGDLHAVPTLLDFKSGQPEAWHPLQTGGYVLAEPSIMRRGCLYLRSDGTYRLNIHADRTDPDVFRCAVGVYHARKRMGLLNKRTVAA